MSDNLRRYRAIHAALKQAYGVELKGNVARHVATLAALISGIVGSTSVQLPQIARNVPGGTRKESRVKRYYRWMSNEAIEEEVYFLPFAHALLAQLALETLVLVIDGSVVGRGCVALMVNVIYKGRALPIAWMVVSGKKGHFAEDVHIALIEQVHGLGPSQARVVVLGDGEFDGIRWQQTLKDYGWVYVCRTGRNINIVWDDETLSCAGLEAHLTRPGPGFSTIKTRDSVALPPSLPFRAVPKLWHEKTPETPCYPILSRLSRPRIAAPRLAAHRFRRPP